MRTRPRSTRSILEPDEASVAITPPPLMGALPRDLHPFRRSRDRPTRLDQLDQTPSTFRREWSVSVHQSLPGVCVAVRQLHTRPGGSTLSGCHQRPDLQHLALARGRISRARIRALFLDVSVATMDAQAHRPTALGGFRCCALDHLGLGVTGCEWPAVFCLGYQPVSRPTTSTRRDAGLAIVSPLRWREVVGRLCPRRRGAETCHAE
jgi:hypothetical protein